MTFLSSLTQQQFDSVPLPRIVDMGPFVEAMLVVCHEYEQAGGGAATKLLFVRKTLKVCCPTPPFTRTALEAASPPRSRNPCAQHLGRYYRQQSSIGAGRSSQSLPSESHLMRS